MASGATRHAYEQCFDDFLFLPGWNRGGGWLGKAGMAMRELERYATGNVFASHPLLYTRRGEVKHAIVELIRRNRIDTIYFHKPHTMLLMRPALDRLPGVRLIIDLHDDFVARGAEYDQAYNALFAALPMRRIVRDHLSMYTRHHLGRTDPARSRRTEFALLNRCDEIFIASEAEYLRYLGFPALRGRVHHRPWPLPSQPVRAARCGPPQFDAGFVGADSVMNLDAVIHLRDEILPLIRRAIPDFRLLLAGTLARKVGPLIAGIGNLEVWDRLADVADFYAAIGVAVVPLRHGTGVSVKAIEAISYGCPMVSTRVGARGLTSQHLGAGMVDVADGPDAFAAFVIRHTQQLRHRQAATRWEDGPPAQIERRRSA